MTTVEKKRKMQKSNGQDDSFPSHAYFVDRDFVTQAEFKPVVDKVNKISESHARFETQIADLNNFVRYSAEQVKDNCVRIEASVIKTSDDIKDSVKESNKKADAMTGAIANVKLATWVLTCIISLFGSAVLLYLMGVVKHALKMWSN